MEESVIILGTQTVLKELLVFQLGDKGSCREDGLLSFRYLKFKMSEQIEYGEKAVYHPGTGSF